jgi:cytochrome P450
MPEAGARVAGEISIHDSGFIADPYPDYARLRESGPTYNAFHDLWLIARSSDVRAVLRDPNAFHQWNGRELVDRNPEMLQAAAEFSTGTGTGTYRHARALVTADPPGHTRQRLILNRVWPAKQIAADMEPQLLQLAGVLVDAFADRGSADLVAEYTQPLPAIAMADALELPRGDWKRIKRWTDDSVAPLAGNLSGARMREVIDSGQKYDRYLSEIIEERRRAPRADVISRLVVARDDDGNLLGDAELLSIVAQLAGGADDTATVALEGCIVSVLSEPGLADRLRSNLDEIPTAVEEALRIHSPLQGIFRRCAKDTELGGMQIPNGAKLLIFFASANRDSAHQADPDHFSMDRPHPGRHVAFGYGAHFCAGAPLVRAEARAALEVLIKRLPHIRLAPDWHPRRKPDPFFRGFVDIQVVF